MIGGSSVAGPLPRARTTGPPTPHPQSCSPQPRPVRRLVTSMSASPKRAGQDESAAPQRAAKPTRRQSNQQAIKPPFSTKGSVHRSKILLTKAEDPEVVADVRPAEGSRSVPTLGPASVPAELLHERLTMTERKLKALEAARKLRAHLRAGNSPPSEGEERLDGGGAQRSAEEQALIHEVERLQNPWSVLMNEGGGREDGGIANSSGNGRSRGFARVTQLHLQTPSSEGLEWFGALTAPPLIHEGSDAGSVEQRLPKASDVQRLAQEMDRLWCSSGVYEHFSLKDAAELAGNTHSIREAAARVAVGVHTNRDTAYDCFVRTPWTEEDVPNMDETSAAADSTPLSPPCGDGRAAIPEQDGGRFYTLGHAPRCVTDHRLQGGTALAANAAEIADAPHHLKKASVRRRGAGGGNPLVVHETSHYSSYAELFKASRLRLPFPPRVVGRREGAPFNGPGTTPTPLTPTPGRRPPLENVVAHQSMSLSPDRIHAESNSFLPSAATPPPSLADLYVFSPTYGGGSPRDAKQWVSEYVAIRIKNL